MVSIQRRSFERDVELSHGETGLRPRGEAFNTDEEEHETTAVPPVTMPVQHQFYDPGERIPSYESSQEQHHGHPLVHRTHSGTQLPGLVSGVVATQPHAAVETPPVLTTTNMRNRFAAEPTLGRIRERENAPALGEKKTLKNFGLRLLNARQHFLLAACRDASLVPCLIGLSRSWWIFCLGWGSHDLASSLITSARVSEHFLTGVWCIVAGYLLFSVLDGLMVRWIVSYSTTGSIVRMATMSAILVVIEEYLVSALSAEGYKYELHTWILISCALTFLYIVQNFVTSNIDLRGNHQPRFFDLYNIVVFAVVPVGMASFITMIGLLRSLLILRLDIDQQGGRA